jgi:hypothetical protein
MHNNLCNAHCPLRLLAEVKRQATFDEAVP